MVPQSAVIVWQLRGFVEEVDCYFVRRASSFILTVERAGECLAEEQYPSLRTAMARARELRRNLVSVGFVPVTTPSNEPQPVLEALLRHFVRDGTAAQNASYSA